MTTNLIYFLLGLICQAALITGFCLWQDRKHDL